MINFSYYIANPVLGKSLFSDCLFLSRDFAVRTVSMETVQSMYFCFGGKPGNSKFATKTAKKSVNIVILHIETTRRSLKDWNQRWMEKMNIYKCKPLEVHFTIRNRVPYNKQLTNQACLGRIGEYWPSVLHSVHTVTTSDRSVITWVRTVMTSGQYSPVWPSRSVSKWLILSGASYWKVG